MQIPEQGQLVQVRGRHYLVSDVWAGAAEPSDVPHHRVRLESLDDDQLGETLDVIWEHEVHRQVHDALGLPSPDAWDSLARFEAFLLATRWSLGSVLEGLPLQAPFRGAIQIEEYQLEPVVRALRMPRVNLLIADDVGLGKTIEAGLVLQELLARQRVRRVLIICPASLQRQWAEEMLQKFTLSFEVVDRAYIGRIRKEYGVHVNPWASYPRLITSMDFLKREEPLASFRASLKSTRSAGLRDWDLLIVDEAHNVAPSGRKSYIRDSDRTRMMREIIAHFEHRLFLTATPHNGFTESFTALLEMLDPLRFARGPTVNTAHRDAVMIRRLKDDMVDALGRRRFALRKVLPLSVKLTGDEAKLVELLDTYMSMRLARSGQMDRMPVRFALTLLKKRLLSSPRAFRHSIDVHQGHLTPDEAPDTENVDVVKSLHDQLQEDFSDDEEKDRTEETAMTESATFFDVTDEERRLVDEMQQMVQGLFERADSKAKALFAWIEEKLCPGGKWNDERLLVFTEYKDTLTYLHLLMDQKGWSDRILTLYGGMKEGSADAADAERGGREFVKRAFRAPPAQEPMRILLATDAAAEGLNLQEHCRYLVHYEIPWNPNRMEQRNGRIDRHGQTAEEVFCHHFVYEDHEDSKFLQTVVDKVQTMRHDLGSVGDVIAGQVEETMLGGDQKELLLPEKRRKLVREEVLAEKVTKDRIRELRNALKEARTSWKLQPETLRLVLDEALRLSKHKGLDEVTEGPLAGKSWLVKKLPPSWVDCRPCIQDSQGRLLKLVFDEKLGRDHKDVTLLHLDHHLIRRALSVFRQNLWSAGFHASHQMARCSYKVVADKDLGAPAVVLLARLVCVSQAGQKLHEELFAVGGEFAQAQIQWMPTDDLLGLTDLEGTHVSIPSEVAGRLRRFFPAHETALTEKLAQQEKTLGKQVAQRLRKHATEEARHVRGLMDERIKELDKRVKEAEKNTQKAQQLVLGLTVEEKEQYQEDEKHLRRRLEELRSERSTEPDAVKARYALRTTRAFPLALLYILPESLVEGGGS